jgi:hypothetical protein
MATWVSGCVMYKIMQTIELLSAEATTDGDCVQWLTIDFNSNELIK